MANISSKLLEQVIGKDYALWCKVLKKHPNVLELLSYLEDSKKPKARLEQIKLAFEHGLNLEQVMVFAKPEFAIDQMEQIRIAFSHKLSTTQVRLLVQSNYSGPTMELIRLAFERGFTVEQVELVINRGTFNAYQLKQIRIGIERGLTPSQIFTLAKPYLSGEEMARYRHHFEITINGIMCQNDRLNQINGLISK